MKKILTITLVAAVCGAALAKLPAPVLDDAANAKAAEAAAKTAWQAKVDAYQLCKAQDKVVASLKGGNKVAAKDVKPVATTAKPPAAAASGTPVAAAAPTIPPCSDPGPFAY